MDRRTAMQSLMTAAAAVPLGGLAAGAGRRGPLPGSGYIPATGNKVRPPKQKMVLVGAGSAMFTQGIVIDWIKQQPEGDWEIALVDINPVILEATEKIHAAGRQVHAEEVPGLGTLVGHRVHVAVEAGAECRVSRPADGGREVDAAFPDDGAGVGEARNGGLPEDVPAGREVPGLDLNLSGPVLTRLWSRLPLARPRRASRKQLCSRRALSHRLVGWYGDHLSGLQAETSPRVAALPSD